MVSCSRTIISQIKKAFRTVSRSLTSPLRKAFLIRLLLPWSVRVFILLAVHASFWQCQRVKVVLGPRWPSLKRRSLIIASHRSFGHIICRYVRISCFGFQAHRLFVECSWVDQRPTVGQELASIDWDSCFTQRAIETLRCVWLVTLLDLLEHLSVQLVAFFDLKDLLIVLSQVTWTSHTLNSVTIS